MTGLTLEKARLGIRKKKNTNHRDSQEVELNCLGDFSSIIAVVSPECHRFKSILFQSTRGMRRATQIIPALLLYADINCLDDSRSYVKDFF